jgi:mannose-6-phosphate isomerase-like protein (cupin superfamily)
MTNAQHIRPEDLDWETFHDPHGRPTTPTRVLRDSEPFLIEADFPANFYAGVHWHPHDTIYLITRGEMRIGEEGSFRPGDIRWVKAGHAYGPEEAGPDGVQFHLFSLGGDIGLNWADLYEVPEALTARLSQFEQVAGRRSVEEMPSVHVSDPIPDWASMPDEGPLIFKVTMGSEDSQHAFTPSFDSVWYVLSGGLDIEGHGRVAAGEFFCAPANDAHPINSSDSQTEWLVFCSRSLQPL